MTFSLRRKLRTTPAAIARTVSSLARAIRCGAVASLVAGSAIFAGNSPALAEEPRRLNDFDAQPLFMPLSSAADGWRTRGREAQPATPPERAVPTSWTSNKPSAPRPAAHDHQAVYAEDQPITATRSILRTQAIGPRYSNDPAAPAAPAILPPSAPTGSTAPELDNLPPTFEPRPVPRALQPEPFEPAAPAPPARPFEPRTAPGLVPVDPPREDGAFPDDSINRNGAMAAAVGCDEQFRSCAEARKYLNARRLTDIDIGIGFDGVEGADYPCECPVPQRQEVVYWSPVCVHWTASALCHKPLYFEDVQLERYGHTWGYCLQPVLSAAHFFGTIPTLPYQMGMDPPWECKYALGYYRPGNCAPWNIGALPINNRGALIEAGVAVGLVFLIP